MIYNWVIKWTWFGRWQLSQGLKEVRSELFLEKTLWQKHAWHSQEQEGALWVRRRRHKGESSKRWAKTGRGLGTTWRCIIPYKDLSFCPDFFFFNLMIWFISAVHTTRNSFVPKGTFGNVWRHFLLSQLWREVLLAPCAYRPEMLLNKFPILDTTPLPPHPITNYHLAQSVSSVGVFEMWLTFKRMMRAAVTRINTERERIKTERPLRRK